MSPAEVEALLDAHLDAYYLVDRLSALAKVPTDVPLGFHTLMEPDEPKLVHYVQDVLRPELTSLGCWDLVDAPGNNLVVRLGRGTTGRSLLLQSYTVAQHHNEMDGPFSGKVADATPYGCPEPAVFGQGVSQGKAHQAVMLAVLRMLQRSGVELAGRLYWAINNEGRSSHGCSEAILSTLDEKPSFGVLQMTTGLDVSLGNRGRVDVNVHVTGRASHSSAPQEGLSAIEGAHEVMSRLRTLSWPDRHPLLGGRQAIVYKVRFSPLAPHTLPSDADLTVDRRLLPGDDPNEAAEEVRRAIGDLSPYEVRVEPGVCMLPALVDPDDPGVRALREAHQTVEGAPPRVVYGQGTFDAGGPCELGVPTVMYGVGGGVWPVGDDFVPISRVVTEARVLATLVLNELAR